MLQSGFSPKEIYERNQEAIKANAFAKMIVGHEFNPPIPPMAAQNEIDIVKSKIFVRYPHLIAQMETRGFKFKTLERSHERAAWEVSRPGRDEPELFEFTIDDAKRAGLVKRSRDGEALQYELRPRVMLWARLVSETYRATGGRGGVYTPEEKREILSHDSDYDDPSPAAPEPERNPFTVTAAPPKEESKAPIQETKATVVETVTHKPEPEVHKSEPVQSGAPEPEKVTEMPKAEEPPRRRGRPPATPKPEGAAAMEQLKKEVPPEAPNGFQATNDDLPDNIAAAPHAEKPQAPAEPLSQVERLTAIKALLVREHGKYLESWCKKENIARAGKEPAITPSAYAHHLLKTFIKAFLKVNTLPTPPDVVFARHLPLFESFAKLYGGQLISKPQEEGAKAGESWAIFVRKIDEWPTGVKDLAKTVAAERYPDEVTSLLEFLDVAGISTPDAEMMAFFKLLRIGNQTLQAAREAAKKRGCSLFELTSSLNLDLADEKQVLSAIAGAAPVQSGAGETGALWDE